MGLLNLFKKKSNLGLNAETVSNSDSSNIDVSKIDNSDSKKEETKIEEVKTEVIKESSKGIEILRKALDYGVTTFQLDFIKGNSISVEYVGNKNDKNVYYCSDIDSFLSVV